MNDRTLNMLGMARRAGRLEAGFERCSAAVKSGKARSVLVCSDISPKTRKELAYLCEKHSVPVTDTSLTLSQLSDAIGFKAGLCAICDDGFAGRIAQLLTENGKDE